MSETRRLAKLIQHAFDGRAFYGPPMEEVLSGIDAHLAAAPPRQGSHNIWQIVSHMATWQETLVRWLQGDLRRPSSDEEWAIPADQSEASWEATRQRLRDSHRQLLQLVESMDDRRLDEPLGEEMPKTYVAIHGILQHNIYHAGQVALLKSAAR